MDGLTNGMVAKALADAEALAEAKDKRHAAMTPQTEAQAQQAIRLVAPKHGVTLWRNNSGATQDATGRQIRFGLGNDSSAVNRHIKSSDLIGITPVVVTQDMVGQTVGIFTSVEVKRPGWVYCGTEREQAQKRWTDLINKLGGRGLFATGPEDVWK